MESKLRSLSENELRSLNALVETAMQQRVDDPQNVAIRVFNGWFESRNKEYPGKLWSVWSPKVTAYMAQAYPDRAAKAPLDEIDQEALRTGRPIARFVDGAYRYSLPIILGQTLAAPKETCEGCHSAGMGLKDGEVIAVFSSSVSTVKDMSALRQLLLLTAAGAVLGGLLVDLRDPADSRAGGHSAVNRHDGGDATLGERRHDDRGSRSGSSRRDRRDGQGRARVSRRGGRECAS